MAKNFKVVRANVAVKMVVVLAKAMQTVFAWLAVWMGKICSSLLINRHELGEHVIEDEPNGGTTYVMSYVTRIAEATQIDKEEQAALDAEVAAADDHPEYLIDISMEEELLNYGLVTPAQLMAIRMIGTHNEREYWLRWAEAESESLEEFRDKILRHFGLEGPF